MIRWTLPAVVRWQPNLPSNAIAHLTYSTTRSATFPNRNDMVMRLTIIAQENAFGGRRDKRRQAEFSATGMGDSMPEIEVFTLASSMQRRTASRSDMTTACAFAESRAASGWSPLIHAASTIFARGNLRRRRRIVYRMCVGFAELRYERHTRETPLTSKAKMFAVERASDPSTRADSPWTLHRWDIMTAAASSSGVRPAMHKIGFSLVQSGLRSAA
jgi:hypothetical protein